MYSKTYNVKLTGVSPLLMHQDDVEWRDQMDEWLKVPENKKNSRAGDDRFPPFRWIGGVYHDGEVLAVPSDNLMTMLREGGVKVTLKGKETFKKLTQSSLMVDQIAWPLVTPNGTVAWADVEAMNSNELSFREHCERARKLGFALFVKPAKVGTSKHVRVRARFDTWSCEGTITVLDERITKETLEAIFRVGGQFCGLMDWRPSSPRSSGRFGLFTAEVSDA